MHRRFFNIGPIISSVCVSQAESAYLHSNTDWLKQFNKSVFRVCLSFCLYLSLGRLVINISERQICQFLIFGPRDSLKLHVFASKVLV